MTDPIGSMINEIKIGSQSGKESIFVKYSKIKHSILDVLKENNFISYFEKRQKDGKFFLEIGLAYENGLPKIRETYRISKPSRRMYLGYREIRPVKGGKGIIVISTPKGIFAGEKARKELVGGEPLFWVY